MLLVVVAGHAEVEVEAAVVRDVEAVAAHAVVGDVDGPGHVLDASGFAEQLEAEELARHVGLVQRGEAAAADVAEDSGEVLELEIGGVERIDE